MVSILTAAAAFGAGAADSAVTTTEPSGLGRFYGFGPMEILNLQWGLSVPHVADVNGDGLNDIIVINNRKSRIDLLLQKPDFTPGAAAAVEPLDDDVNDLFGREKTWRFKRVGYDLDVAASAVVIGDLNGDGRMDLAYTSSDALRVALQDKPAEGIDASTGPAEPVWLPAEKFDVIGVVEAGDLTGDGRIDLIVQASDRTNLLIQKSDGSLAQPVKYHNADAVRSVWIADVDGDGRNDLVLETRDDKFPVRVRYQGPDGGLGPLVRYELPAPRVMEVTLLAGDTPMACFASVGRQGGRLRLSAMTRDTRQAGFPVLTYPLPESKSADSRDTVVADVDGDGLDDVVVSDPARGEFLLMRANAATALAPAKRFPGLTDMRTLAAANLDGVPGDELVVLSVAEKIIAVSRWTNGRLSYPESVAISGEPVAMDLADVDGDGRIDLLYVAHEKGDRKYFLRTVLSVGGSDAAAGGEVLLSELKDKPKGLVAADVDGDKKVDAMVLRGYGPLLLVRRDEAGAFVPETRKDIHSGLVSGVDPAGLSLAPLGPDGATALLLTEKNFARAVVFDPQTGWKVVDQYQAAQDSSTLTTAATCRLGDQTAPAVVTYDAARRKLGILTRQDDGTYRPDREIEVGAVTARKILTGNFGGASVDNILLCGTRKLVLVPTAGRTGVLRKLASFEPKLERVWYGAVAVGDINADGTPEVVLCDQGRHHIEILAFDAAGALVSATRFKVFESPRGQESRNASSDRKAREPRALRVADVTGDGKNDLILLVHDRLIVYPQE